LKVAPSYHAAARHVIPADIARAGLAKAAFALLTGPPQLAK
jgi:hypothetical protein